MLTYTKFQRKRTFAWHRAEFAHISLKKPEYFCNWNYYQHDLLEINRNFFKGLNNLKKLSCYEFIFRCVNHEEPTGKTGIVFIATG